VIHIRSISPSYNSFTVTHVSIYPIPPLISSIPRTYLTFQKPSYPPYHESHSEPASQSSRAPSAALSRGEYSRQAWHGSWIPSTPCRASCSGLHSRPSREALLGASVGLPRSRRVWRGRLQCLERRRQCWRCRRRARRYAFHQ